MNGGAFSFPFDGMNMYANVEIDHYYENNHDYDRLILSPFTVNEDMIK